MVLINAKPSPSQKQVENNREQTDWKQHRQLGPNEVAKLDLPDKFFHGKPTKEMKEDGVEERKKVKTESDIESVKKNPILNAIVETVLKYIHDLWTGQFATKSSVDNLTDLYANLPEDLKNGRSAGSNDLYFKIPAMTGKPTWGTGGMAVSGNVWVGNKPKFTFDDTEGGATRFISIRHDGTGYDWVGSMPDSQPADATVFDLDQTAGDIHVIGSIAPG